MTAIDITEDVRWLARAMQQRDAEQFGYVKDGVQHPTWDECGDDGRDDYRRDASWTINMLIAIRGYWPERGDA